MFTVCISVGVSEVSRANILIVESRAASALSQSFKRINSTLLL